ncbi:MAG: protein kinase domain-containing protein [Phycisphaerales bacterium]
MADSKEGGSGADAETLGAGAEGQGLTSRLEALLFTDIVDSTGIKARSGTMAFASVLQRHNELFERCVRAVRDGRIVKHTGDGYFARFATASEAVRAALLFHAALAQERWASEPIRVRCGVHIGEVAVVRMADRTDIVGRPADIAARIMSLATGGQTLTSGSVATDAQRFLGEAARWFCHGRFRLKGVPEPIEVWEAAGPGAAGGTCPPGGLDDRQAPERRAADAPAQVGPYRILELVGEGGMGRVYKAEQRSPVKRMVALKIMKPGFDSGEVIARFQSERQALARMDHAGIAKVLDAGTDELGRPYFVMEYVAGVRISRFADENRLTLRERLELFIDVCDAIAHAHSKAIIHRDIKSSNILAYMADGRARVKVIDFGIAKALTSDRLTERTFNTDRGQVLGTYSSMSPEQAAGSPDIDTRTDVYSLGVLLYELLSGERPFDDETLAKAAELEVRRLVCEVEPPRPSTRIRGLGETAERVAAARCMRADALARTLATELEWIPLMAMRKERARRYASPLHLADDVRNYLRGSPLIAGPESRGYRARKFVVRNRAMLSAVGAAVFLGTTGTAAYVWAVIEGRTKADAALEIARTAQNKAERARTLAEERLDGAVSVLDKVLAQLGDDRLKNLAGAVSVREVFLENAVVQYRGLLGERPADTALRSRLSESHRELGTLLRETGRDEAAGRELDRAVAVWREAVLADGGAPATRVLLARALLDHGRSLFTSDLPGRAEGPAQ